MPEPHYPSDEAARATKRIADASAARAPPLVIDAVHVNCQRDEG